MLPEDEPDPTGPVDAVAHMERRVVITDATARHSGPPGRGFLFPGDSFRLEIQFQVNEPLTNVAFGCEIFASNGSLVFNCDSAMSEMHQLHDLEPGRFRVEFDFDQLPLLDGAYTMNARIQDAGGGVVHARREPAATFEVVNPGQSDGGGARCHFESSCPHCPGPAQLPRSPDDLRGRRGDRGAGEPAAGGGARPARARGRARLRASKRSQTSAWLLRDPRPVTRLATVQDTRSPASA